jgi:hypothetical protein
MVSTIEGMFQQLEPFFARDNESPSLTISVPRSRPVVLNITPLISSLPTL